MWTGKDEAPGDRGVPVVTGETASKRSASNCLPESKFVSDNTRRS